MTQGQSDITRHESLKSKLPPQYANVVSSLDAFLSAMGVDSLDDLTLYSDGTNVQISLKNPSEEDEMKVLYLLNEDGVNLDAIEYNGDTGTSTF